MAQSESNDTIHGLRVHQWHPAWEGIEFDPDQRQRRPEAQFYLFSLPAAKLRSLSGIYRRDTSESRPRSEDLGIQRRHDPERSAEISRYVVGGYPWSTLSEKKREDPAFDNLRKPGWLPTAVVVNLLEVGASREGQVAKADQVIDVRDVGSDVVELTLPGSFELPPIEVIDGQHRLFAFDEGSDEEYQLPVVAFRGLDISWQAYLFWTINIKPKKINPSLAFDLYPLLREQNWLESGEVVAVYKESRAQELTEALWATPESPWYQRVNMLGGPRRENGPVTQAAFIRSLVASMVKAWRSPRSQIGGIFGGVSGSGEGLSWSRLQQAAFLISAWSELARSIGLSTAEWAVALRDASGDGVLLDESGMDPAFAGSSSLLATDQGVRGFLHVVNDLCFVLHRDLELAGWRDEFGFSELSRENILHAMASLREQPAYSVLIALGETLAEFDWRTGSAPGLNRDEELAKTALRGSSGYKVLRGQLFDFVSESGVAPIAGAAQRLIAANVG